MTRPDFEATADAFNRLSDPVRVELLRELWLEGRHDAVPYAELQSALGIRDSGRFNYHLKRLRDAFVEKTDDGYRLTAAGLAVVDAVQSETFAPDASMDRTPVDGACPSCEVAFEAAYEDGLFRVVCPDCDGIASFFVFPPRGVEVRDPGDAAYAHGIDAYSRGRRAALGLCPYCGGRTDTTVTLIDTFGGLDHDVITSHECRDCDGRVNAPLGSYVHHEPAVVAFCHDHGVDPRGPAWRYDWCVDPNVTTVLNADPVRAEVSVVIDGDELQLTLNDAGDVVASEHVLRS